MEFVNGVFKGGGAKGIAYAGALRACEELGLEFRAVAGSSAGAITAALVAVGYSSRELEDLIHDALDRIDRPGVAMIKAHRAALLANTKLRDWLNERLEQRLGVSGGCTFAQIREATGVSLYVVVMDLGSRQPVVFSPDLSPQASVADAVVASSAIPVAFPPGRMIDSDDIVHRLIDGGVWANYPSLVFLDDDFRACHAHDLSDGAEDRRTIGFVLDHGDVESRPSGQALRPAGGRPLNTDRGSAEGLGLLGAFFTSRVTQVLVVTLPFLNVLLLAYWVGEGLPGLPAALTTNIANLAAVVAVAVVAIGGAAAIVAGLAAARLGRSLADTGLTGAVAAMGVGPSVPYWAGKSSKHTVIRIKVPKELSTLDFGASEELRTRAIEAGHEAAMAADLVGTPPDDDHVLEPRSTSADLEARPKNPDEARQLPGPRDTRVTHWIRGLSRALGLYVLVILLVITIAEYLVANRDGKNLLQFMSIAFIFVLLAIIIRWYGRRRLRDASETSTFLRQRSTPTLLAIASLSAVALATLLVLVEQEDSLVQLLRSEPYKAEILSRTELVDDNGSKYYEYEVKLTAELNRCEGKVGEKEFIEVSDSSHEVGEVVEEYRLDIQTCDLREGSYSVDSDDAGSIIVLTIPALLWAYLGTQALSAVYWRHQRTRAIEGDPPSGGKTTAGI
ncbi:MAG: patatin-like phospholipase family protein [Acidimicrobiales bacterium]